MLKLSSDLIEQETEALFLIRGLCQGHRDIRRDLVEELCPAVERLIAKGLVEQVWVVSEAGHKLLAEDRADAYLVAKGFIPPPSERT